MGLKPGCKCSASQVIVRHCILRKYVEFVVCLEEISNLVGKTQAGAMLTTRQCRQEHSAEQESKQMYR